MANNPAALKVELINLLTATANLDSATKTKLRDAFAAEHPNQYTAFLNGQADTPAKRGEFAIEKTFDLWQKTVGDAGDKAYDAARPARAGIT